MNSTQFSTLFLKLFAQRKYSTSKRYETVKFLLDTQKGIKFTIPLAVDFLPFTEYFDPQKAQSEIIIAS